MGGWVENKSPQLQASGVSQCCSGHACFLPSMLITQTVIMWCLIKSFFHQIYQMTRHNWHSDSLSLSSFSNFSTSNPTRELMCIPEISQCWAYLEWRLFCFWGQAFECKLIIWPALVWSEKTKGKMNKILLFCHVKWLEAISMLGFLPIMGAFMNSQLCQENITFFIADYPPGVNCIISYSEEDYCSHLFSG